MNTLASYFRIIFVFFASILLLEWIYDKPSEYAMTTMPYFWLIVVCITLFAMAFEISVTSLKSILFRSLNEEEQERFLEKEALRKANRYTWVEKIYTKLKGTKPIEEEHDIILDHNYDGIKELDNKLPPWWVYGFYMTILFAAIYLVRFEIFSDYDQAEEYENEVAEAKAEIEEWKKTAKDLVDVNSVVALTDATDLNAGKTIFESKCVACHMADGGGGIGPNLTDQYWILGGGIKNIFNTISEGGRDGKGMVAWKKELKPSEMAQVASYVLTFEGTTPANPKEAQGEIWTNPDAKKDTNNSEKNIKTIDIDSTTVKVSMNK